jgi:hypothetical protein
MELRQVKGFDAVRGLRGLRSLKSYLLTGGVCLGVGIVVGAWVAPKVSESRIAETTVPRPVYEAAVANGERAALLWQKSLNPRVKLGGTITHLNMTDCILNTSTGSSSLLYNSGTITQAKVSGCKAINTNTSSPGGR